MATNRARLALNPLCIPTWPGTLGAISAAPNRDGREGPLQCAPISAPRQAPDVRGSDAMFALFCRSIFNSLRSLLGLLRLGALTVRFVRGRALCLSQCDCPTLLRKRAL